MLLLFDPSKYTSAIIMEAEKDGVNDCAFNKLFIKKVPHILQKIFFSLDYKSFKRCEKVCVSWQAMLASESFGTKVNVTFRRKIIKFFFSWGKRTRTVLDYINVRKKKENWFYSGSPIIESPSVSASL